jgi:hypothetical protein
MLEVLKRITKDISHCGLVPARVRTQYFPNVTAIRNLLELRRCLRVTSAVVCAEIVA